MIEVVRREVTNKQTGSRHLSAQTDRWKSETGWSVALQPHSSNSGYIRVDAGIPATQKISGGHGWLAVDYLSSKASFHRLKSTRGPHSPFLGRDLTLTNILSVKINFIFLQNRLILEPENYLVSDSGHCLASVE